MSEQTYPVLSSDLTVDVAIIGGGMAGLLNAYLLAKAGKSVAVLEAKRVLSGVTSLTTAFITQMTDTSIAEAERLYGPDKAKLLWQSHGMAIHLLEQIVQDEKIACDFSRCSNFLYAQSERAFASLQQEQTAMERLMMQADLKRASDLGFSTVGYLETPGQAKFDALAFLRGLLDKLKAMGVQIFEQTPVVGIEGSGPVLVHAADHIVRADYSITATYQPCNNPPAVFMKKAMYTSYVFEVQVPKGFFREGLYEDTHNPYHYFRIDPNGKFDRMIVGGEDNRQEFGFVPAKNFAALTAYVARLLGAAPYSITSQWSGPILEPSDGLALIGAVAPHQLVATAFSGNGMTYSAISAMMLRDIIVGNGNAWIELYNPKRSMVSKALFFKALDYGQEFMGGALRNSLRYLIAKKD